MRQHTLLLAVAGLLITAAAQGEPQLGGGVLLQRDAKAVPVVSDAGMLQPNGRELSGRNEKYLLNLVNQARVQGRTCGDTAFPPAPPLTWEDDLEDAAQRHSNDMAFNNFFSHTGSDGSDVGQRVTAAGYDWRMVGENIAAGQRSIAEVVQAWLDSPGHCANIMNAGFKEIGAAVAVNPSADFQVYWTQVFATPLR